MSLVVETCKLVVVELVKSYDKCLALFHQVDWWEFLQLFHGQNNEFMRVFPSYFNGRRAHVGDMEIKMNLEFVVADTHLPVEGESWFKHVTI